MPVVIPRGPLQTQSRLFTYPLPVSILNFTDILVRAEKIVWGTCTDKNDFMGFSAHSSASIGSSSGHGREILFINGGFTVLWDVGMGGGE